MGYEEGPAIYQYEYAVDDEYSGVYMGKNENRDGYNTYGSYKVRLPDGRLQIVTYTVDGYSGYIADVQYEGAAAPYVPAPAYKPAPYAPPAPAYAPAPIHAPIPIHI